jgi:hypothetical protein
MSGLPVQNRFYEKLLPGQQKCLFLLRKREGILKNPLRRPIFPMNLNGYSKASGVLHLKSCPANEPVLCADEGMEQIASLHHFLVALIVSLGDIKPGPNVRKVGGKYDHLHTSLLCRLLDPSANPFA